MKRIVGVMISVLICACAGLPLEERHRQMVVFDTCMAIEIRNAKPYQVSRQRMCGCAIQATGGREDYLIELQEWETGYTGAHLEQCTIKSLYE